MPDFGTLVLDADSAPEAAALATEPVVLEAVQILHVMAEIPAAGMLEWLPPALNPTIPPTVTWTFWKVPASPWGAFSLHQTRIGCRAGIRPRGYSIAATIDNASAGAALDDAWGYGCAVSAVRLDWGYHRVAGSAPGLSVTSLNPEPVSGKDILYVANMHLARTERGPRLVQVDPGFAWHKVDRGRVEIETADVPVSWPIAAFMGTADVTMPAVRYLTNPSVPALAGTEKVSG